MRRLWLILLLAGAALAQPTGGGTGKPPCSSTVTINCSVNADGAGNVTFGSSAGSPGSNILQGTTATDSASLGAELTTNGTCSGTGWTGTYPNYVAPGTTAPLTCTGFTSGQFYQTVTTIGAGGSGAVTIAIGTAQTASGTSGTVTAGLKANGTSLTYTPAASYTGTIGISAKLITPISTFSVTGKDSTGTVSGVVLWQTLASLHNSFSGGGGSYNTTGNQNSAQGYPGPLLQHHGHPKQRAGGPGPLLQHHGQLQQRAGILGPLLQHHGHPKQRAGIRRPLLQHHGHPKQRAGGPGPLLQHHGHLQQRAGGPGPLLQHHGHLQHRTGILGPLLQHHGHPKQRAGGPGPLLQHHGQLQQRTGILGPPEQHHGHLQQRAGTQGGLHHNVANANTTGSNNSWLRLQLRSRLSDSVQLPVSDRRGGNGYLQQLRSPWARRRA